MVELDARRWAEETFGDASLGDPRRTRRLVDYAAREAEAMQRSTSAACRGNSGAAEGAYKFVRNEHVHSDDIAEAGFQATAQKADGFEVLLALEDSTTLGYRHAVAEQLGSLGGKANAKTRGFWVHSVLLVAPEPKRTIGLLHQQRWIRPNDDDEVINEKESEKWNFASECVAARMGERMARVISVCDREADIYDYLSFKLAREERFVVRAKHDRALASAGYLWDTVGATHALGTLCVQLPQRGGKQARAKREAILKLRAAPVDIKAPQGQKGPPMTVWAVYAREEAPPDGAEALEWMLLTSEDASTYAAASKLLGYYAARWTIEDFHKAWKSGTGVEERKLQSPDNIERVAVILAFLAVRMLQLAEAYAIRPEAACDDLLDRDEWRILWVKTEEKPVPASAPNMAWAYKAVAKLGGWLDTKRTGRAGWEAMTKGWLRLVAMLEGYRLRDAWAGETSE